MIMMMLGRFSDIVFSPAPYHTTHCQTTYRSHLPTTRSTPWQQFLTPQIPALFVRPWDPILSLRSASPSLREGVLCTTTVIPAKAGASADGTTIQRGEATTSKAKHQP